MNIDDVMNTSEARAIVVDIPWRRRVLAAMLNRGISLDIAGELINGVIDDVLFDEREEARNEGAADERALNSEY